MSGQAPETEYSRSTGTGSRGSCPTGPIDRRTKRAGSRRCMLGAGKLSAHPIDAKVGAALIGACRPKGSVPGGCCGQLCACRNQAGNGNVAGCRQIGCQTGGNARSITPGTGRVGAIDHIGAGVIGNVPLPARSTRHAPNGAQAGSASLQNRDGTPTDPTVTRKERVNAIVVNAVCHQDTFSAGGQVVKGPAGCPGNVDLCPRSSTVSALPENSRRGPINGKQDSRIPLRRQPHQDRTPHAQQNWKRLRTKCLARTITDHVGGLAFRKRQKASVRTKRIRQKWSNILKETRVELQTTSRPATSKKRETKGSFSECTVDIAKHHIRINQGAAGSFQGRAKKRKNTCVFSSPFVEGEGPALPGTKKANTLPGRVRTNDWAKNVLRRKQANIHLVECDVLRVSSLGSWQRPAAFRHALTTVSIREAPERYFSSWAGPAQLATLLRAIPREPSFACAGHP